VGHKCEGEGGQERSTFGRSDPINFVAKFTSTSTRDYSPMQGMQDQWEKSLTKSNITGDNYVRGPHAQLDVRKV
jgi:hypothetical protein